MLRWLYKLEEVSIFIRSRIRSLSAWTENDDFNTYQQDLI